MILTLSRILGSASEAWRGCVSLPAGDRGHPSLLFTYNDVKNVT